MALLRLLLVHLGALGLHLLGGAGILHLLVYGLRLLCNSSDVNLFRADGVGGAIFTAHGNAAVALIALDSGHHGSLRISLGLHLDGGARLTRPEVAIAGVRLFAPGSALQRPGILGQTAIVAAIGRNNRIGRGGIDGGGWCGLAARARVHGIAGTHLVGSRLLRVKLGLCYLLLHGAP